MSSQQDIETALHQWADGDRNAFKRFFQQHPDILNTYDGPGDVFNYFLPALYVKEFCDDLVDAHFPVEYLFAENLEDFAWVDWPKAIQRVSEHAPALLIDLNADGVPRQELPSFASSSTPPEDRQHRLDYLPKLLQAKVIENAQAFFESTDEVWDQRHRHIQQALESPLVQKASYSR